MTNIIQAANWLANNQTVELKGDAFVRSSTQDRIRRLFARSADRTEVQKIANFIQNKLSEVDGEEKRAYLSLADAFIIHYRKDWNGGDIARVFDRTIVTHRNEVAFSHQDNMAAYQKWLKYGMPSEIYHRHQDFCQFVENSGLLSQMKVTKDTIREIGGEPCLKVNGKWAPWTQVREEFEYVESKGYHETFIVHKRTRDVYTYLDNDKGLQKHHPYLTETNPTSVLTRDEYLKVMDKAKTFVRPGEEGLLSEERDALNKKRTFVIQLVTSYVSGPNTNAHELVQRRKHPYLRLIVGEDMPERGLYKGDVMDVGYGWKEQSAVPFATTQGRFRSPDVWEYLPSDEKVVTNMPVTKEEANAFSEFTLHYHRNEVNLGNPIGFHIARQNCSSYVRTALAVAGINVPTEISLTEAIRRISPDWFQTVRKGFDFTCDLTLSCVRWLVENLPKCIEIRLKKVAKVVQDAFERLADLVTAITLFPANAALGGGMGSGGAAFVPPAEAPRSIRPALSNWKNWFRLSAYQVNLPGVLQEWQRNQESTVVYHRPVKLTIVP